MKALRFLLAAALTLAALGFPVSAAPGDLDLTFGNGGKVTTAIGSGDDSSYDMTLQADGKIILVGSAGFGTDSDFVAVRYNADGSLDSGFGFEGKAVTSFGTGSDVANGVAIQSDGKIVVAGTARIGSNDDFAIVRYNADGSLDASFGSGGKVTTNFVGNGNDGGEGVVLQEDGKIVVVGKAVVSGNTDFAVVRYNADGTLDTSFGGTGMVTTAIGTSSDYAYSVALQGDGKIVAAGFSFVGAYGDVSIARYNLDGSLDNTFGSGGRVTTAIGSQSDVGNDLVLQSDGKIVVAGYSSSSGSTDVAVLRYNADGSLDTSFGLGGRVTTAIGSSSDYGYGVALQNDGKIVVAGYFYNGSNDDVALVRYNANGSLDTTFSGTGKVTRTFGSGFDYGRSVVLQADGKILVAGYAEIGATEDFVLARFEGSVPAVAAPTSTTGTASSITTSGATVSGTVNANGADSTVTFQYGLTTAYGSTVAGIPSPVTGSTATAVSAVLTGLASGTTYHYRVVAANSQGTVAGLDQTFTTAGPPGATTGIASGITKNGAMLTGTVNAGGSATDAYFEYGTTTDYGVTTTPQAVGAGTSPVGVQAGIGGLSPNTRYHYRLVSTNAGGTSFGNDAEFTTDFDPPTAVTNAPSSITTTSATLRGTVNPSSAVTTVHFEYGATAAYGSATPGQVVPAGSSDVLVSAVVTGLEPGVFYHFRVVASNAKGTTVGGDGFFGTPPGSGGDTPTAPPTVTTSAATAITVSGASLNGVVNPNGGATVVQFEYGLTTSYGSTTSIQNVGNGGTNVNVSETIAGLQPATEYHYRLVASNSLGTTLGPDRIVTTDFPPPTVTTDGAEAIGSTFATLKGTVNPNNVATSVSFAYGESATLASATAVPVQGSIAGAADQPTSVKVTGLIPQTQYYYRVTAASSAGTTQGAIQSFTTLGAQAPVAVDDVVFTGGGNVSLNVIANDVNTDTGETAVGLSFDGIVRQGAHGQASGGPVVNFQPDDAFPLEGDSFDYRVKTAAGLTDEGTVRVLPFGAFKGGYGGTITGGSLADGGLVTLELGPTGSFTGQLRWQNQKYPLRDTLESSGRRTISKQKIGAPEGVDLMLTLQLDRTGVIFADLLDESTGTTLSFVLRRAAASTNATPGTYTATHGQASDSLAELAPRGDGLGSQLVTGTGYTVGKVNKQKTAGRLVGRVGDSEPYSGGSKFFEDRLALNSTLYPKGRGRTRTFGGSLTGDTQFNGDGTLTSVFEWIKQPGAAGLYPNGFRNGLQVTGERFYSPGFGENPFVTILTLLGAQKARVEFEEGDLDEVRVADVQFTLVAGGLKGRVLAGGTMPGMNFKVNGQGVFSGAFTHPTTQLKTRYFGTFRKNTGLGQGNFRGATTAGSVKVYKAN